MLVYAFVHYVPIIVNLSQGKGADDDDYEPGGKKVPRKSKASPKKRKTDDDDDSDEDWGKRKKVSRPLWLLYQMSQQSIA